MGIVNMTYADYQDMEDEIASLKAANASLESRHRDLVAAARAKATSALVDLATNGNDAAILKLKSLIEVLKEEQ